MEGDGEVGGKNEAKYMEYVTSVVQEAFGE